MEGGVADQEPGLLLVAWNEMGPTGRKRGREICGCVGVRPAARLLGLVSLLRMVRQAAALVPASRPPAPTHPSRRRQ